MNNLFQGMMDWLAARFAELMATLNPISLVISIAAYVASLLPVPDPRLAQIVSDAVSVINTFARFIGLFDYIINLPVFLVVIGIILVIETGLGVIRAWRLVRSFVT